VTAGPARILLFTGKGGVGKTTAAAATALRCADSGLRTIVLSTDPAHSLADAFGVHLGAVGTPVTPNLWGQQLDAQERLEEAWADIQAYLMEVMSWAGVDGIEAEELSVLPGLDEVFALADIRTYAESGEWDVVVVDCAPTGETLRLLSLPDVLAWYMDRVFPVGRRVNRIVGPVLSRVSNLPVAGDSVFAAGRRFYDRLDGVRELLTDPERTRVRLVVNPERMVIAEARRTHTYLALFGYRVDAVIANRLLPDEIDDPWFKSWKETQAEHLATIVDGFAPVPVLRAQLASDEIVGVERLRAFAEGLYREVRADGALHTEPGLSLRVDGDTRVLVLPLPGADRDEIELGLRDDELLVRVGPYRRAVLLPDSLHRRPVLGAVLEKGALEIRFGQRGPAPGCGEPAPGQQGGPA
jgi:arsenite/tail-anchored protein-transporting ATPase